MLRGIIIVRAGGVENAKESEGQEKELFANNEEGVKEMGENLYEVDHFYNGDFAQFLTGGYSIKICPPVGEISLQPCNNIS